MSGPENRWAEWLRENEPAQYNLATKQGWDAFVHTAPRAPLERLSRADLDRLSAAEREDYDDARAVWNANPTTVHTAQLARAYGVMDQVMASNQRDSDRLRGAVVIDAAPALGKTTIATRYARDLHRKILRRHGPRTPEGHQRLPVVYLPLSAGTTLKGLNQKLLRFYGHPAATRSTRAELGSLAVDCVQACRTQLIIIDVLHFIDFKHRHGHEVSNHLKGLANEMPVTFLYVGVRLREKRFFDEGLLGEDAVYAQTSRRATRCEIAPFTHATTSGARAWSALLAALEAHVILTDARPGMLTDHAQLLAHRTQGCIGSLTNLLDRVCYLAIATGAETITKELITQSRSTMQPNSAPAPPDPPRDPRQRPRVIPGGYDLDTPPIHVAPIPGESAVSWLRRAAVRYQISPRNVLRAGGATRQISSTRAATTRITSPQTATP